MAPGQDRDRRELRRRRPEVRQAGDRRLLGAVVRPCRQVSPILDEIAGAHADKIEVVKINTDENPAVTARYGVTALPTLAVYSGGELVKTVIGAKPKPILLREFSAWLG